MASLGDDIFSQAMASFQAGRLNDAEQLFKIVLRHQPKHVAALNLLSVLLTRLERYAEAEKYIKLALKLNSNSDATYYNYGLILKALQRPNEALERFSQALSINATVAETWNNRGTVLNDLKRYDDAVVDFDKAVGLHPNYAEAFCNKGKSLAKLKRYEEALGAFDKALALNPDLAEGWVGCGNVFNELKRYEEAFAAYDSALALKPDFAEAWLGSGNVSSELKRYEEAFAAYDKALSIKSDLEGVWLGRGNVFNELKRDEEAFAAYDKALALKPDLAEAWLGRGNVFFDLKRYDEALASYDNALTLKHDCAGAWHGRGNIFDVWKRHEEAAAAYVRTRQIDPQYPLMNGRILHQKMHCCDWKGFDDLVAEIDNDVASGKQSIEPFAYQAIAYSAPNFKRCAEVYAAENYPRSKTQVWRGERYNNSKIRVGYVSGEFRNHVTSRLMTGLFERHDKNNFDIFAFDSGWDDGGELRGRINKAFDNIIDIRRLNDLQAAEAIKQNQIDILVNLNGYFGEHRTRLFSYRPSPVQVSYLGFSATMGADYIDYIIGDKYIIPPESRAFYTEKIVYLPGTYQVNDKRRPTPACAPTRVELMLPETGFVFCCFNNNFKITPEIFDVWMRVLNKVDKSVLWLLESNPAASRNLREEAKRRNIAPERLVFSSFADEYADYLARYRVADLFLDTLPFNAGGTASDALWAGLPLLTCSGQTYTARMGGSLLKAMGAPELITTTLEDYAKAAIDFATHPEKLAAIKRKLAENRFTAPLFDTELSTKHIEAAYNAMYERHQAGLAPDNIIIPN